MNITGNNLYNPLKKFLTYFTSLSELNLLKLLTKLIKIVSFYTRCSKKDSGRDSNFESLTGQPKQKLQEPTICHTKCLNSNRSNAALMLSHWKIQANK